MSHWHWDVQAFRHKRILDQGGYAFDDFTDVQVSADTEENALKKAKGILKRKYYRISKVWECSKDHELEDDMKILQMKLQNEMLKKI